MFVLSPGFPSSALFSSLDVGPSVILESLSNPPQGFSSTHTVTPWTFYPGVPKTLRDQTHPLLLPIPLLGVCVRFVCPARNSAGLFDLNVLLPFNSGDTFCFCSFNYYFHPVFLFCLSEPPARWTLDLGDDPPNLLILLHRLHLFVFFALYFGEVC